MRKPGPTREIPPPLEVECLKALWALGEANVKQVREWLEPHRPLAYTTVMTLLERLVRKSGACRRKVGRSFLYSPLLARETLCRLAVKHLVETLFDGSEDRLRTYLGYGIGPSPAARVVEPGSEDGDRLDTALL
jgi:predicted transcriptional regulator